MERKCFKKHWFCSGFTGIRGRWGMWLVGQAAVKYNGAFRFDGVERTSHHEIPARNMTSPVKGFLMLGSVLTLCLASVVSAAPTVSQGTLLSYRGDMVADKGDPAVTRKSIELTVLVTDTDDSGATLYWTVEEEGRGGWRWPNQFGRYRVDDRWRGAGDSSPSLLYFRDNGKSIVQLATPLLAGADELAQGATWKQGKLEYRVIGTARVGDRDAWRIEAKTAYGLRRVLLIDKQEPVALKLKQIVFIGNGEKHELKLDLVQRKTLGADELAATVDGFESLVKLRDQMKLEPRRAIVQWDDDQLAALKSSLPSVTKLTSKGLLVTVAKAVQEDAQDQKNRAGAVTVLRQRTLGKKVEMLKLEGLLGEGITQDHLKDNVTVLHFWEYKATPLEEPYGQVGYLDFLYRQHKAGGVKVYGVAVDPQFSAGNTPRRKAISSARKLRSFMNLSYPLLLDDGAGIRKFGDPRITGAKLPLYVVVGPDGRVIEYHSGLYEISRDRGLADLDKLVKKALDSRQ